MVLVSMKFKNFFPLLLCILLLSMTACSNETAAPQNEILSFYLNSDPITLDPQIVSDYSGTMLVTNLFEGLVRQDSDGNILPGMAESWEISDDGLTYTFKLIEKSCWSNGTEVTADDFVFGIKRSLMPETKSENAADLFAIKNASSVYSGDVPADQLGIKAVDKHTLTIQLEYETNALLQVLTTPAAMPCNEDFFESSKGKYGKDYDLIITNGPFKIRENYGWDHDKYIFIRRSDEYLGSNKAIPLGVNFTFASQPDSPVSSLASGDIDLCEIYGNQLDSAKENSLNIYTTSNTLWGICYNTDIKAFKNAKLRVSLLSSLDRENLLKNVPESYIKSDSLISDSVNFAGDNYRSAVGKVVLEPSDNSKNMFRKATEELAENEIELNSSYTIIYLDDSTSSDIVTSIIETWNETTGLYFNKEALSRNELESRINKGNYDIAIAPLNTAVDSPMEFFSKFVKNSPNNYINLTYSEYDSFIEQAISSEGRNSVSALAQAEKYLVEYGYLYPLFFENRYFATPSNVSGVIFSNTSDAIDFSQITKIAED